MLNFIFRRYHYFIVYKVNNITENVSLDLKIQSFIKKYFFLRGRKVNYFEPYTSKLDMSAYLIFGSSSTQGQVINRNSLIFLLELYASLNDENIKISPEFKKKTRIINNTEISIYRIKK
jgi:hypothetical protein